MSNQIFSNSTRRYFPLKKQNLYSVNADIVIPDDTGTLLQMQDVDQDQIGPGLTYSAGIFTIVGPEAEGMMTWDTTIIWASDATKFRQVFYTKNNATATRLSWVLIPAFTAANAKSYMQTSHTSPMRIGDTMEIFVIQDSGGDLSIIGKAVSLVEFSNISLSLLL